MQAWNFILNDFLIVCNLRTFYWLSYLHPMDFYFLWQLRSSYLLRARLLFIYRTIVYSEPPHQHRFLEFYYLVISLRELLRTHLIAGRTFTISYAPHVNPLHDGQWNPPMHSVSLQEAFHHFTPHVLSCPNLFPSFVGSRKPLPLCFSTVSIPA